MSYITDHDNDGHLTPSLSLPTTISLGKTRRYTENSLQMCFLCVNPINLSLIFTTALRDMSCRTRQLRGTSTRLFSLFKKTQSGWFGDFDPSTGALHLCAMHMCLLMSSSIVVKSIVGYVCVWHGYWTFNFIQDNRTQLQSFRQSCAIDRPFRLSPSYVVVVDVTVVLYT